MEDADTCRKRPSQRDAAWIEFARGRLLQRAVASSRVEVRLPLDTRHATERGIPVIACYIFENATVCLGIRSDNR
jgi:hypothetical protein